MIVSVCYLFLFLFVGLLLARRAVPDADSAVLLPLGCGLWVSLLAVLRQYWAGCCCGAAPGCVGLRRTPTAGQAGPACCLWPP